MVTFTTTVTFHPNQSQRQVCTRRWCAHMQRSSQSIGKYLHDFVHGIYLCINYLGAFHICIHLFIFREALWSKDIHSQNKHEHYYINPHFKANNVPHLTFSSNFGYDPWKAQSFMR